MGLEVRRPNGLLGSGTQIRFESVGNGADFLLNIQRVSGTNKFVFQAASYDFQNYIGENATQDLIPDMKLAWNLAVNKKRVKTAYPTLSTAILTWAVAGVNYATETALNQAGTTTLAGFPVGAGKGAVNVGRYFGDPKAPRNYGLFTPDGRRISD